MSLIPPPNIKYHAVVVVLIPDSKLLLTDANVEE